MIQYNILKQTIKKNYKYVLIFILYLLLSILILKLQSSKVFYDDILMLIDSKNSLLINYKTFLIIFLTYYFYTYEITYIYDSILLRINKRKFYISKIIFILLFIVLFNIVHYGILRIFFKIDINILLNISLFYILLSLIEVIFVNLINNKLLVFILTYILSFMIYNIKYRLLFIVFLMVINYILLIKKRYIIME